MSVPGFDGGLNEQLEKSRNFIGFMLVLALLAVYGGTTIPYGEGTWFYFESEFESTNGDTKFDAKASYLIDEIKVEGEATSYGEKTSLDDDSEYSDYGFNEREEVMDLTRNLALLSILLAGALFALVMGFLNGQFEKEKAKEYLGYAKNISLGLIVVCLLNAGNFALNYPEAWRDDTDNGLETACGVDDEIPTVMLFVGGCENENTDQVFEGITGDYSGSWHPGPAWLLTFVVIPGIAAVEYFRLKELDETGAFLSYTAAPPKKPRKRVPRQPHAAQPQTAAVLTAEVVASTPVKAETPPPTKKKTKKA
ncbi:MAG TPA: hypothetical protein EYN38_10580, partial [Flavobacteriales bacterium]|nr:hypothetical protein [Flavobacteriales bacterium]